MARVADAPPSLRLLRCLACILLTLARDARCVAGAFRQPYGSDTVSFFGVDAVNASQVPRLLLKVDAADAAPLPSPAPTPELTPSQPGTIVAGNRTSIEISCDGGPNGIYDGWVGASTADAFSSRCRHVRVRGIWHWTECNGLHGTCISHTFRVWLCPGVCTSR